MWPTFMPEFCCTVCPPKDNSQSLYSQFLQGKYLACFRGKNNESFVRSTSGFGVSEAGVVSAVWLAHKYRLVALEGFVIVSSSLLNTRDVFYIFLLSDKASRSLAKHQH